MGDNGVQKSSAGASEFVTTLTVSDPEKFIGASSANGWKFYSAVAPTHPTSADQHIQPLDSLVYPLATDPCVLVLGNEDLGLPFHFTRLTQHLITITGSSEAAAKAGLDSLNVSVAGAVLCNRFLQKPPDAITHRGMETEEPKLTYQRNRL